MHQIFLGYNKKFPSSNLTNKSDPKGDTIILNLNDFFGPVNNIKEVYEIFNYLDGQTFASKQKLHLKFRSFFTDPSSSSSSLDVPLAALLEKWNQIKRYPCQLKIQINSFKYYLDPQTGYILNTRTLKEWYSSILESSLDKKEKYHFQTDYLIAWYRFKTYWKNHQHLKELIEKCDTEPELEKQGKFRSVFERILKNESKETSDHHRTLVRLGPQSENFTEDLEIIMRNKMRQQLFHQVQADLERLRKHFRYSLIYLSGSQATRAWIKDICQILKYSYESEN